MNGYSDGTTSFKSIFTLGKGMICLCFYRDISVYGISNPLFSHVVIAHLQTAFIATGQATSRRLLF